MATPNDPRVPSSSSDAEAEAEQSPLPARSSFRNALDTLTSADALIAPATPAIPNAARALPMVDTGAAIARYVTELEAAASRVLRSGRYILGPEVKAFEEEASSYLGSAHGVGVSSGTDGLFLALRALDVGPGDEVLVPAFGFVATVEAVVRAGARPIFVDVLPACGRIDLADADKKRTARTRAVIHVPLGGHGSGTGAVARWAAQRSVFLIEDAAQSFGALDEGRAIGTFGAIGVFSFFPAKVLGGFGDGGLVVTNQARLADAVRSLRQHGRTSAGRFAEEGTNARLDELQAALLRVRLAHLADDLAVRRALADRFDRALIVRGLAAPVFCKGSCEVFPAGAHPPFALPPRCTTTSVYGLYSLRMRDPEKRASIRDALRAAGIETQVYYERLLCDEVVFHRVAPVDKAFPGARDLASRTLTLPFFVGMTPADIERIADALAGAA